MIPIIKIGHAPLTPASLERGVCQVEIRNCRLAARGRELWTDIDCPRCGRTEVRCRMRFHLQYDCPKRTQRCRFCEKPVAVEHLEDHLESKCEILRSRDALVEAHLQGNVLVDCKFGCDLQIRRKEMVSHCKTSCEMRLAPCPNCGSSIAFARLKTHMRRSCGNPFFVAARKMAKTKRESNVSVLFSTKPVKRPIDGSGQSTKATSPRSKTKTATSLLVTV